MNYSMLLDNVNNGFFYYGNVCGTQMVWVSNNNLFSQKKYLHKKTRLTVRKTLSLWSLMYDIKTPCPLSITNWITRNDQQAVLPALIPANLYPYFRI